MERLRVRRLGASLTAALALAISACTSPSGAGIPGAPPTSSTTTPPAAPPYVETAATEAVTMPDITTRPISASDLAAMLPTGESGPAATERPVPALRTNEDLVVGAVLDRADESGDIEKFSRITGVGASYPSDRSTAHVWIDLFATPEGASGWAADTAEDIVKRSGGSHQPSIDLLSATDYPFGVGEDPAGLILQLDGGARTETIALFRMGRLVIFTSIVRDDDADARVPVQYLAEETAGRVLSVLSGTSTEAQPAGLPGSYEFAFERTVESGGSRWSVSSSGTVAGGNVRCRVRADLPGLTADRELIAVGDRTWARDGSADFAQVSRAGAVDGFLLSLCPAWPIDPVAAGLTGALDGTPASHQIGGVPALGYLGSGEGLEQALGIDPDAVEIEVFNIWVAAEDGWLLELDLRLSGDPALLSQLIGTGYPDGAPATISVAQQITSIDEAGPVMPPG